MSWLLPPLPPTWDAALRDVRAQHAAARIAAAQRLSQATDEQRLLALPALLALAKDRDARVRAAAFESLAELAEASALPACVAGTQDDDPLVRELAVIALSHLPPELCAPALLDATASPHPELRFQAVLLAAEHCPQDAEPIVRRLLQDADSRVRASAVRAAGVLGATRASALARALGDALTDSARQVRAEAALLLTAAGDARASAGLVEALQDPELCAAALDAAPELGAQPEVVAAVAALAQSFLRPRIVKAAAARALARMGDPRGPTALREVLTGLRGDARSYAVEVVGELGLAELTPELVALTRRPRGVDRLVIAQSLASLAELGHPAARTGLAAMVSRGDAAGAFCRDHFASLGPPKIVPNAKSVD